MTAIEDTVIQIVATHFQVDISKPTLDAVLVDDLGADSLDAIELILLVENDFSIEVFDHEIERVHTVQDIVNLVNNKV